MTSHPIVFNVDDTASPKGMWLSTSGLHMAIAARAVKEARRRKRREELKAAEKLWSEE